MAFYKQDLDNIYNNVKSDFESTLVKLPNRRDLVLALIKVLSGVSYEWQSYIEWVLKQSFATTAEEQYLEKHGESFGVKRKQATKAHGVATFEKTSHDSVIIPRGTILQSKNGIQFKTTTDNAQGSLDVECEALISGQEGNIGINTPLSLVTPIESINGAKAKKDFIGGVDKEDLEAYRQRIIFVKQNPPHGDTVYDYIKWANEVPGVTRAWCQAHQPVEGQVTVRFMTDGLTSDGFPSEDKIAEVKAYIENICPSVVILTVAKPLKKVVNVRITGLDPNTAIEQERVKSRIKELFLKRSKLGGTISKNRIIATITNTQGVSDFTLVEPASDVVAATNELCVLGDITIE